MEAASRLIAPVLSVKSDELTQACREFLEQLKGWLEEEGKEAFRARGVRRAFRMSPSAAKRCVRKLRQYGLLEVTGEGHRYRGGYEYELTRHGRADGPNRSVEGHLQRIVEAVKPGEPG